MALYNPFEQAHFSEAGTRLAFLPGGAVPSARPNQGVYLMSILSLTKKEYQEIGLIPDPNNPTREEVFGDEPDGDEGEDSDPFAESDEDHEDLPEH